VSLPPPILDGDRARISRRRRAGRRGPEGQVVWTGRLPAEDTIRSRATVTKHRAEPAPCRRGRRSPKRLPKAQSSHASKRTALSLSSASRHPRPRSHSFANGRTRESAGTTTGGFRTLAGMQKSRRAERARLRSGPPAETCFRATTSYLSVDRVGPAMRGNRARISGTGCLQTHCKRSRRSCSRAAASSWLPEQTTSSTRTSHRWPPARPYREPALTLSREAGSKPSSWPVCQDDGCGRSRDAPVLPTSPPAGVLPVGRRPVRARLPPGSGCCAVRGGSHEHQEPPGQRRGRALQDHASQPAERPLDQRRGFQIVSIPAHDRSRWSDTSATPHATKGNPPKPSDGLEPSTPLTMEGEGTHERSLALTNGHEISANVGRSECTVAAAEKRSRWNWWTENGRKPWSTNVADCQG
jgi:hypothetical protein